MFSKLNSDFLCGLSDEQIRGLDYSKVGPQQLECIFNDWRVNQEDALRKVACIPLPSIQFLLIVKKVEFLWPLLSDVQSLSLDITVLDDQQIKAIFFPPFQNQQARRQKIGRLSIAAIHEIMRRGVFNVLTSVSDAQFVQLDLHNIPQEYVDELFPSLEPAQWYPRWTYVVKNNAWCQGHLWEADGGGRHFMSNESLASCIEKKQTLCRQNFQRMSKQQFETIKNKIHPNVLAFLERGFAT